ncbi:DUF5960 family protein [Vagococcus salmoninarum]|uniref:DUF5960 family protein n=1 Tax=Vagococcus salmoninarum TaxID=2739 RepID=UPI00188266F0|nr:DUF5960 family protein [Vagococcus salmoninarum]MBE9390469.1 hypothetical protein [Vagococcus salmoninarum]
MRNKEKFINDVKEVIKPDLLTEEQLVEDAAHTMTNTKTETFTLPKEFTKTDKEECFLFTKKYRAATDGDQDVDDFFYLGRGE